VLRNATRWALGVTVGIGALAGCAHGGMDGAGADAASGGDAAPASDAGIDALAPDAAPQVDAGCAISSGVTPTLGGADDLAAYPAAQQLAPGAALGTDGAAIAWDATRLYVTVRSDPFTSEFEPLHVYVEATTGLGTAAPSQGKEYSSLVPQLPFTPTHLIAVRRVTDGGSGPYDGVFVPTASWSTRATALEPGTDVFVSADQRTISVQVPWAALGGCPTALRLAAHVVHAVTDNEWKELVPDSTTPWVAPGGGYYEIDLTGAPAVAGWTLR